MEELEFIYTPPLIGAGKHKAQLVAMNNHDKWGKFYATRIKSEFKDTLKEWYLPERDENPYQKAEVTFTILRNNNIRIDADAMSFVNKWFLDTLTEQGYLVDDDKVRVVLEPPVMGLKSSVETQVRVHILLKDKFIMTVPDLAVQITGLDKELNLFFSDKRTKAGAERIRRTLEELKLAVPQLRKDIAIEAKSK